MTQIEGYEEALFGLSSVVALDALLEEGMEALPESVAEPLRHDDVRAARDAAESWSQEAGFGDRRATLAYAILQENCDEHDEAMVTISQGRDVYPEDPVLALGEAELRLDRGEFEEARELLEAVGEHDADEVAADAWGFAGDLWLDLGDEEPAIDCYERAFRGGTERFETTIRLGQMWRERDDWEAAAEAFERAAELGGDAVGPWYEAAECRQQAGDLEGALEAREHVLDLRGRDPSTWAEQGIGYRRVGDEEKAVEALRKATRLAPEETVYWLELAGALMAVGEFEEAVEAYKRVLDREPELQEALVGLARAMLQRGDLDRAARRAEEAIEVDDEAPEAWGLAGEVARQLGNLDAAAEKLGRARELSDEPGRWKGALGEVLLRRGDHEEGLALVRDAEGGEEGGTSVALAFALLKADAYDELAERVAAEPAPEAPTWALVRPVFGTVVDGLLDEEADADEDVERHVGAFEEAVDSHGGAIPVEADLEELERYGLVLGGERREMVERMVAVLEGRRTPG